MRAGKEKQDVPYEETAPPQESLSQTLGQTRQHNIVFADSAILGRPGGHYSHTCTAAGLVFVSGQLPIDAHGKPMTGQPFELQVEQVLANLDACLEAAGTDRSRLLQVRVYVTDMNFWPTLNRIYANWVGELRPARAVAGVASLHFDLLLEIEAVALSPL